MSYVNYHSRRMPSALRYMADLLRYRHLAWNLVGSDLRSRFRRSHLGILWAMLQPLGYSLVIAWAWGAIFQAADYWSFALYVYSGMLVWDYFTNSVMASLDGLASAVGYLRQSRIPFFVFQIRIPLSGMVVFYAAMCGLLIMMLTLGRFPTPGLHLLLLPAYSAVLLAFMMPVAILMSVVGTQFRDLKHIMTIALQALFFLSPVMMQRDYMNDGHLAILQYVNPLVPLLDMLRDPVLHGQLWDRQDVNIVLSWSVGFWLLATIASFRAGRKIVFAL